MTAVLSTPTSEKSTAQRQIESFRRRFGEGHFYFACHAALPLALTPDLLYCLWANFQRDSQGEAVEVPWIAVADLMLSNLCEEVGHELYEIDTAVQAELMHELGNNARFGSERIRELADFVITYTEQELNHPDLDLRDLAEAQKWRALAYSNPEEAAHQIAQFLAQLNLSDKTEWIRMAALLQTLAEPLFEFQPLLLYAQAIANFLRGNNESATELLGQIPHNGNQIQIAGANLRIPDDISLRSSDNNFTHFTELNSQPKRSKPNRFREAVIGGISTVVSLLLFWIVQQTLRAPNYPSASSFAPSASRSNPKPLPSNSPNYSDPYSSPRAAITPSRMINPSLVTSSPSTKSSNPTTQSATNFNPNSSRVPPGTSALQPSHSNSRFGSTSETPKSMTQPIQVPYSDARFLGTAYGDTRFLGTADPLTQLKRSVVLISSYFNPDGLGQEGTGFVIQRQGDRVLLLTTRHIVTDSWGRAAPRISDDVNVAIYQGKKPRNARVAPIKGKVLNISQSLDLALVEFTAPGLPADIQPQPLNLNPQDNAHVTVIGQPSNDEWKIDAGKIIDISPDQLRLAISLNVGNSGSPVLDQNGAILGIITTMSDKNYGWAIPARRILQQFQEWGITP